jgi:hypothetical protein
MQRRICSRCLEYHVVGRQGEIVQAYQKPKTVVMLPAYINQVDSEKRSWVRIGYYCPVCGTFEVFAFKPKRHGV